MNVIVFLIVGLVAGLLARAIFPGNQNMGVLGTTLLGIVGSFIGGGVWSLMVSNGNWLAFTPSGLLGSTIGAILVLGIASLISRRSRA
ncbi:MAG: GlsB/YeaQ/YmgE family stress response membrane protein [Archangium sp.]|nr:GlsB/YeaQ/YmgE family stress response membrane protein [Archangium sp.]